MNSGLLTSPHIFSTVEAAELGRETIGTVELFGIIDRIGAQRPANVHELPPATPERRGLTLSPRQRLLSALLNRAQHDFHHRARMHLYFCFLSEESGIRAYHTDKERAFEVYTLLVNRLCTSSSEIDVSDWLRFVLASVSDDEHSEPIASVPEVPCSGVINVQLDADLSKLVRDLADAELVSMSKFVEGLLRARFSRVRTDIETEGSKHAVTEIQRLVGQQCDSKNHTMRVDKSLHAAVVATASELEISVSLLCTSMVVGALLDR